jgi:phosphoenolpyruvate phosphomutase
LAADLPERAQDTASDPDFCVVARVESFIAGWGLDETLERAARYAEAGADAVLIHSKKNDPSDIESFMQHWDTAKVCDSVSA